MQENIKIISFGCRLNALECEKISAFLSPNIENAILVNTCAVTHEAERQSGQAVRSLRRKNPNIPIFVTGCAATRNPTLFRDTVVINNFDKMKPESYGIQSDNSTPYIPNFTLSKAFIQIQNGCDHGCTYCITRVLRGHSVSFDYETILTDVRNAVANGFYEIVLTGIDIASYPNLCNLCEKLLRDEPRIQRLRLSSMDPASSEIPKIIALIKSNARMMPHLHLSMQSGSDTISKSMGRRHTADMVRRITHHASRITFSWDIICGFPGETDELFNETVALARELHPIKIHAFPMSPRPGTPAEKMPNAIPRPISSARVKIITKIANENLHEFMKTKIGTTTSVLVENNNIARTPDDIDVKIVGCPIPSKTICNVKLINIEKDSFIGKVKI